MHLYAPPLIRASTKQGPPWVAEWAPIVLAVVEILGTSEITVNMAAYL